MPRGRGLDPDTQLQITMYAEAHRWAREGVPWDEAVDRLRDLVQARPDLAGDAVGQHLGGYLTHPHTTWPTALKAAALLAAAGADPGHVNTAVERTRKNALSSAYTDPGSQAERRSRR